MRHILTMNMARIGAAAIAHRGVRRRNANLLRTACGSIEDCVLVVAAAKTAINSKHGMRIH